MAPNARDAQAFFDERAEEYRRSASHANAEDLSRMLDLLGAVRGERALDLATGGGHTAVALARAGARVVAADVSRPMLEAASRGAAEAGSPVAGALTEAHALAFASGAFDVVATRIAPHHFENLDRALREVARVLAPGGRFYAFDLTAPEDARIAAVVNNVERLRDPSHVESYSLQKWRDAVEGAGLHLARSTLRSSDLDYEAWIRRARMPPEREAELRRILAESPAESLGGYGLTEEGRMRVLRVELLAAKPRGAG